MLHSSKNVINVFLTEGLGKNLPDRESNPGRLGESQES